MARQARVEVEGGLYHVITRGNNRRQIFNSPADYEKFLLLLAVQKTKLPFFLYAYCLMTNHVHLLLERQALAFGLYMLEDGTVSIVESGAYCAIGVPYATGLSGPVALTGLIEAAGQLTPVLKGNNQFQGWVRGNPQQIYEVITKGATKLPSGAHKLADGTKVHLHISSHTSHVPTITVNFNAGEKIINIRIVQ